MHLSYLNIVESKANEPLLEPIPAEVICARFAILRTFNRYVQQVLPYLQLQGESPETNLGQLVRRCRESVFTSIKVDLFKEIIQHTSTYTRPSEDPYEDPPDLKQITLNRHKAAKALQTGSSNAKLRHSLFGQAASQLDYMNPRELRRCFIRMLDDGQQRTFKVKFVGEGVTDNGGPYRECFNDFVEELFRDDASLPLFIRCPNGREAQGNGQENFICAPTCERYDLYRFFGKLMGIAIRNEIYLDLHLPPMFWRRLVGLRARRKDLYDIDAPLVQRLVDIEQFQLNEYGLDEHDGREFFESQFEANFEVTLGDGHTVLPMMPEGQNRKLTYSNRLEWVRRYEQTRLHESDSQLNAIREGLSSIVPLATLELFGAAELEQVVAGHADFSVELLKSVTVYEGNISPTDAHIVHFWRVMNDLTAFEKSMFVKFVWARARLPTRATQFSTKFKIQEPRSNTLSNPDMHLPQSHTCFFSISLPAYTSPKVLRSKLLYAAYHCQTMDRDLKLQDSELYDYDAADIS